MYLLLQMKRFLSHNRRIVFFLAVFIQGLLLRGDVLHIHHIGVGQGDATLIVAYQNNGKGGLDTTSILIDAGNSSGKGEAVFVYLSDILGTTKHINFIITSHLHSDHIGGMPAVLQQLRQNNWNVNYIIDRGESKRPLPDICYSNAGDVSNDPVEPVSLPGSKIYESYEAECASDFYKGKRYNIMPGADLFRALNRNANMSMMCVAANGCNLKKYQDNNYLPCPDLPKHPDENDFSFAFLLQFEGFKYFTGGDIGGGGEYLDQESLLIPYFKSYNVADFHFCGYKASHHGSGNSNNEAFINYAQPQLILIPSALRSFNGTQLPWQDAWTRLKDVPGSLMTYTYHYLDQPYQGRVDYYFDVKFEITDPGICKAINVPVYVRSRSKASPYDVTSSWTLYQNYACNKPHNPPGATCGKLQQTAPALPPHQRKKITRLKKKARRLDAKAARLERQHG